MDLDLAGKVAVVVGGSSGLGKATASELVREGATVALVARDRARLERAASEMSGPGTIFTLTCDTTSDASVAEMAAAVLERCGRVDVLVNSAARPGYEVPREPMAEVSADTMWAEMNVKVMGYLRCVRAVAPSMIARRSGRIINVSGLAARQTGSIVGSIRNVAVAALTKNLADELSPHGITVVCVHPGLARTEKLPIARREEAEHLGISEADVERRYASHNLLGRLVDAADVAHVITFLASPRSVAINGDAVAVGGGVRGSIHY